MDVRSCDIIIHATVYIRCESEEEFKQKAAALEGEFIYFPDKDIFVGEGIATSGRQFGDPDLPVVTLSPAMTIGKPNLEGIDLAQENIPEPEEED